MSYDLFKAICNKDIVSVESILNIPGISITDKSDRTIICGNKNIFAGATALDFAIIANNLEIVKLLVNFAHDHVDEDTMIEIIVKAISKANKYGYLHIFKYLLEYLFEHNQIEFINKTNTLNALNILLENSRHIPIINYLVSRGANINHVNLEGMTLLLPFSNDMTLCIIS